MGSAGLCRIICDLSCYLNSQCWPPPYCHHSRVLNRSALVCIFAPSLSQSEQFTPGKLCTDVHALEAQALTPARPVCVQLREELGPKAMTAREAPAKWSLLGVNRKPELIEKRRRELEAWLWKLIADPRAARSRSLNNFLELSDVARVVTRRAAALGFGV